MVTSTIQQLFVDVILLGVLFMGIAWFYVTMAHLFVLLLYRTAKLPNAWAYYQPELYTNESGDKPLATVERGYRRVYVHLIGIATAIAPTFGCAVYWYYS